MRLLAFWQAHASELGHLVAQHVALVVLSTATALVLAVPLGIVAAKRPRLGGPILGFANLVQTIPSLALFGFLLPLPLVGGIGPRGTRLHDGQCDEQQSGREAAHGHKVTVRPR